MSSSTVLGQNPQTSNCKRISSTPKKRYSYRMSDIAAETEIFENIFRKIYGPRKIQSKNNCLTSPTSKFRAKT